MKNKDIIVHGLEWLEKKGAVMEPTTSWDDIFNSIRDGTNLLDKVVFVMKRERAYEGFRISVVHFVGEGSWSCEYRGLKCHRRTPKMAIEAVISIIDAETDLKSLIHY